MRQAVMMTFLLLALALCYVAMDAALVYQATREFSLFSFFGEPPQGAAPAESQATWKLVLLTLLGITAGEVHRQATERVTPFKLGELFGILLSPRLVAGVMVAPIVLGGVLAQTKDLAPMLAMVTAFENGFFWNKILSARAESGNKSDGSDTPSNTTG